MIIRINLEQISFFRFIALLLELYWKWWLFYGFLVVLIFCCVSLSIFRYLWACYHIILFFGIFFSFVIHEYMHIFSMKICCKGWVILDCSLYKISVIPEFPIERSHLFIVSMSGPLTCLFICGIILLINYYLNYSILTILACIYFFHIINLVPPFGDGKMLLKSLIRTKDML